MLLRTRTISNNINQQLRKEVAMAYRLIRRSLLRKDISPEEVCSCSFCEAGLNKPTFQWRPWMSLLVLAVALGLMCLFAGCAQAQEFTNVQIVDAIYLAEGGSHAQFAYGIRSVQYGSIREARRICLRTIKHYRRKYENSAERRNEGFVEYVQSHYCPTKGALSSAEKKLNHYWIRNVRYFLSREER